MSSSALAVPVTAGSEEWEFLEYFLQLCCRSSQARVKNAWGLSLPDVEQAFEQRSGGSLVLPCWFPVSQLEQSVQSVCERGFRFECGVLVQVGNLPLPTSTGDSAAPGLFAEGGTQRSALHQSGLAPAHQKVIFEAFLCHAGVGRSQLVTSDDDLVDAEKLLRNCGSDFDSVYIHRSQNRSTSTAIARDEQQHTFQHEYLLKDNNQLLPKFLVHFELDRSQAEKFELSMCDECGCKPAVVWCEQDAAKLCEDCDLELHSLNKIVARHVRVPVYEMPRAQNQLECCRAHNLPITHHNSGTGEFLCAACVTAAGGGARGLTPIQEAYKSEVRTSDRPDVALNRRRDEIKHTLVDLEKLIASVQRSGKDAEDRVYGIVQECLSKFQTHTEAHVRQLLSDNLNAKRQLEFFDWTDTWIKQQMLELSPPDFLRAWTRHRALRSMLGEMWANGSSSSSRKNGAVAGGGTATGRGPKMKLVGALKVATAS